MKKSLKIILFLILTSSLLSCATTKQREGIEAIDKPRFASGFVVSQSNCVERLEK